MTERLSCSACHVMRALGETEGLALLKRAGFGGVDYGMHAFPLSDARYTEAEPDFRARYSRLNSFMHDIGLAVCQFHTIYPTYVGRADEDDFRFTCVRRGIIAAGQLHSRFAVVHPRIPAVPLSPAARAAAWALNRPFYGALAALARDCGVQIAVENMYQGDDGAYVPSVVSTAEDMREYIDRLNEDAGEERFVACLDTGHAHLLRMDVARFACDLGSRLRLMHAHDNNREGDRHDAPWQGSIDWTAYAHALAAISYGGWISLETDGYIRHQPPDNVEAAARVLRDRAAKLADGIDLKGCAGT